MISKYHFMKYFLLLAAIALTTACSYKDETITDKNKSISVVKPSFWMEINTLNEAATIQIANPLAEAYFIIISEARADFPKDYTLKEYSELTRNFIKNSTVNYSEKHDDSLRKINGMKAMKYIIDAKVDNVEIRYWHISVASKNHFYQLIPWSLTDKMSGNEDNFIKIVKSFRETEIPK
jgi:hypothetical protein